jgi:mono/diheme cytochrome c family protein
MMPVAALSAGKAILIGIASGLAVLLVAGASLAAMRRRRAAGPDIPPAMRPGPSDPDLEGPVIPRLYAWGTAMVLILAISVAGVFIRENVTNANDLKVLQEDSVERGHLTTLPGSEANQIGFNCQRCHGSGLTGGRNVYNQAIVPVPNLTTVCGGEKYGHGLIKSLDDVVNTIAQGRDGTDMPSWSVRYKGAMDDQQIEDVVNYLLSIQGPIGNVPADQNVCLHPEATPAPSASGSASPSTSASASPSASPTPTPSSSP